jgi:ElaB/YqjD/DUF883 family membrane-anchored ribosome-binding protein
MDNQKSNEGSARNTGQSSGTSIGKDQGLGSQGKGGSGAGSSGTLGSSPATSTSSGAVGGISNAGPTGTASSSTMGGPGSSMSNLGGTSAAGSTGNMSSTGAGSMGGTTGAGSSSQEGSMGGVASAINPQEIHRTIDKAAQAAQPMVERLASTAHAGVDRVSNLLSGASQSMGQRQQQITDAYGQLMESSREYIRQRPGTSMAIAVGAGFLLAKLFSGSRREY